MGKRRRRDDGAQDWRSDLTPGQKAALEDASMRPGMEPVFDGDRIVFWRLGAEEKAAQDRRMAAVELRAGHWIDRAALDNDPDDLFRPIPEWGAAEMPDDPDEALRWVARHRPHAVHSEDAARSDATRPHWRGRDAGSPCADPWAFVNTPREDANA